MAENEYTAAPSDGNSSDDDAERDERRRLYAEDRERRQRSARVLGEQVTTRLETRLRALADDERPAPTVVRLAVAARQQRAKTWKSPNAGKKFRTAAALEGATREDCHAGFTATWGYSMTEADRAFFSQSVHDLPLAMQELEGEARDIYGALRKAIAAAAAYADRTHTQSYGVATMVLGDLWGRLPILPEVSTLPGYRKSLATRRSLVEAWQEIAHKRLGRLLATRELAELSVLLGVAQTSYAALFRRGKDQAHLAISTADVLRAEAKALDKLLAQRTAPA